MAEWNQEALFDMTTAAGKQNFYGCKICNRFARFGSDETARVNGWTVYAGRSIGGGAVTTTLCPAHSPRRPAR